MTEFVFTVLRAGGYWGIAFLMALENVIPPIPSELIMGLGGISVARGGMEFVPLLIFGTVGTTIGNLFWYWVGRRFGFKGLKPFVDRWGRWLTIDWEDIEKVDRFFKRYGGGLVFVFRFLPTFRTMISLPAGMAHMPLWRFLLWTFAGSAIWNTVLIWAGYELGTRFSDLERYVGPVAVATVVAIIVFYVWRVITWTPRAQRQTAP
jgi:membrane protein DedA with SNARE-associated domain